MPKRIEVDERESAAAWLAVLLRERQKRKLDRTLTTAHNRQARELCSMLIWKFSEASGKYNGCRYWSKGALASKAKHGKAVTSANRVGDDALRHEHLFPRRQLIDKLFMLRAPTEERVTKLLNRLNVGVVVTLREHKTLAADGDLKDPWKRYREAGLKWEDLAKSKQDIA